MVVYWSIMLLRAKRNPQKDKTEQAVIQCYDFKTLVFSNIGFPWGGDPQMTKLSTQCGCNGIVYSTKDTISQQTRRPPLARSSEGNREAPGG
jgi:hypothetical protein